MQEYKYSKSNTGEEKNQTSTDSNSAINKENKKFKSFFFQTFAEHVVHDGLGMLLDIKMKLILAFLMVHFGKLLSF